VSSSDTDEKLKEFSERIETLSGTLQDEIKVTRGKNNEEIRQKNAAIECLTKGFGPSVAIYIEARLKGNLIPITPEQFQKLEAIMNGWLELYTEYLGEKIEANFSIREAAVLFLGTHDIQDVAEILTRVPKVDK